MQDLNTMQIVSTPLELRWCELPLPGTINVLRQTEYAKPTGFRIWVVCKPREPSSTGTIISGQRADVKCDLGIIEIDSPEGSGFFMMPPRPANVRPGFCSVAGCH